MKRTSPTGPSTRRIAYRAIVMYAGVFVLFLSGVMFFPASLGINYGQVAVAANPPSAGGAGEHAPNGSPATANTSPAPPPSGASGDPASKTPAEAPKPTDPPPPLIRFLIALAVLGICGGLVWYTFSGNNIRANAVMAALVGLYVVGLITSPLLPLGSSSDWMVLDLAAVCVSLAAGFFGFLFGLPQTIVQSGASTPNGAPVQSAAPQSSFHLRPSTNLETVSDGLTKFITGAAFASIAVATGYIGAFGNFVQAALHGAAAGALAGDMVLVGYGSMGFVIAYIITRTVLSGSFQEADDRLLNTGSTELDAELPDLRPEDATPAQADLAKKIAAVPFESLRNQKQRVTWARAQTIVGDTTQARVAYANLYGVNPNDFETVIGFATAIYNDTSVKDEQLVLSLVKRADELAPDDDDARARIASLKAATYLYVPKGYLITITTVNEFLKTGAIPSKILRFYRACGFGQLYRAYKDTKIISKGDPADAAITRRITNDTAISVAFGKALRDKFVVVATPTRNDSEEDDLQAFSFDHPDYAKMLDDAPPPEYPDRAGRDEPSVVPSLPNIASIVALADGCPP